MCDDCKTIGCYCDCMDTEQLDLINEEIIPVSYEDILIRKTYICATCSHELTREKYIDNFFTGYKTKLKYF